MKQMVDHTNPRRDFFVAAANMSWQLAIVVLVPIIGGAELDKAIGNSYTFTIIGLVLALVLATVVLWRAMQAANRLPVPKLTAAQKRAIRKSYEEDDD
jgi:hypothetical protein